MKLPPKTGVWRGGRTSRLNFANTGIGSRFLIPIQNKLKIKTLRISKDHLPEKPTGSIAAPKKLTMPITVLSGVMIHPPRKPFVNLARISSSER